MAKKSTAARRRWQEGWYADRPNSQIRVRRGAGKARTLALDRARKRKAQDRVFVPGYHQHDETEIRAEDASGHEPYGEEENQEDSLALWFEYFHLYEDM